MARIQDSLVHVLETFELPDRFEPLHRHMGDDVTRLLVEPNAAVTATFKTAARTIRARGQGAFLPMLAPSGTGKTTLAQSLGRFMPREYADTISYDGEVSFHALKKAVDESIRPSRVVIWAASFRGTFVRRLKRVARR